MLKLVANYDCSAEAVSHRIESAGPAAIKPAGRDGDDAFDCDLSDVTFSAAIVLTVTRSRGDLLRNRRSRKNQLFRHSWVPDWLTASPGRAMLVALLRE